MRRKTRAFAFLASASVFLASLHHHHHPRLASNSNEYEMRVRAYAYRLLAGTRRWKREKKWYANENPKKKLWNETLTPHSHTKREKVWFKGKKLQKKTEGAYTLMRCNRHPKMKAVNRKFLSKVRNDCVDDFRHKFLFAYFVRGCLSFWIYIGDESMQWNLQPVHKIWNTLSALLKNAR